MALFDFTWNAAWSNTTKPRDRDKPFHRINSPSYDEVRPAPSGEGYKCGCRSPDADFTPDIIQAAASPIALAALLGPLGLPIGVLAGGLANEIFRQLVRVAPAWVPVERRGFDRSFVERETEVEGVLCHSFQTWTDVPLFQWHRWYDWNFHLVPAKGYKYLRGRGNEEGGTSDVTEPFRPVTVFPTMECEWDTGAFGANINDDNPGAMVDPSASGTLNPQRDWAWPQSGQYTWMTGRWIYDCGHASPDRKNPNNGQTLLKTGLMRSELHPCKAMATARWEAVKFEENEKHVPAIQFMFFASKHGGYFDFPSINNQDYEFIVDLPSVEGGPLTPSAGHTPDFPITTVVLRPRLLVKVDDTPFSTAAGPVAKKGEAPPIIEILPPADPNRAPEQVKIKIPLTSLGADRGAYGVIMSLGWFDADGSQARKVKKVTVNFPHLHKGSEDHETFKEEWRVRVGINGRWFYKKQNGVSNNTNIPLGKTVELFLAEEDRITITAHGMEEDLVGDVIKQSRGERTLNVGFFEPRRPAEWFRDIDQPDDKRASAVAREFVRETFTTFNDQNDPLGHRSKVKLLQPLSRG